MLTIGTQLNNMTIQHRWVDPDRCLLEANSDPQQWQTDSMACANLLLARV